MISLTLRQIEWIPWYVFAAFWLITALRTRRIRATEKSANRLATLAVMCAAFVLLFDDRVPAGPLDRRFLPDEKWIACAGIGLTCVGVAIAIWARSCLGEYWSARVALKEEHQLIRSGPYRYVRHPIYAGMLLGAIGTTLVLGEWRGVIAVVLILIAHSRKAAREEALLTAEFGEEYLAYRRSTRFLFPGL